MPHACCVPACNGNYRNGPKVRVFNFPKDGELRRKWIRAIVREDFVPTNHSRVNIFKYFIIICIICSISSLSRYCSLTIV